MRDRLSTDPVRRRADLSLYLVTDAALCGPRGVVAVVAEAVAGGVTAVQLRDKTASDAELLRQLEALADVIDGRAMLVVNDRLDVAVAARARGIRVDGVHLGQGDAAVAAAREALGPSAVVGLTANTVAHLEAVERMPRSTVDYVGVGVIRPTATKADHPPALGIDGFAALAAVSPVPCVAIGGVQVPDVPALRAAGAAGIAVVSAICAAAEPREAAAEFVRAAGGTGLDASAPSARAARPAEASSRPALLGEPAERPALLAEPAARHARPVASGVPRVLSIAGSDPSGGAGIQADLKSIAAVGGYGMAAITALTAQNTRGVRGVHVPPTAFLRDQLDALSDDVDIDAVKVGMLANAEVIDTAAAWVEATRPPVVVLDPVMVATSGDRLLDAEAEAAMGRLLPLAHLVTPNLDELAVLANTSRANTWDDAIAQAESVSALFGLRVLVKGGHLGGSRAPDALVDASTATIVEFDGERIATTATHGTGCSLSSAVATLRVSRGGWEPAIEEARRWLRESIRHGEGLEVGSGHGPVSHFAGLWSRGGTTTAPTPAELEAEWWSSIDDVRAGIDQLPFIRGLADGTLRTAPFLDYLAQDALYLGDYARVLAEASRLAPDAAAQAFWANSAHGALVGELELHASWLGGEASVSGPAEPDATTTAYLDHLLATAARGDYPVLVAALLPCFWLYTDLGERLAAGEFGAAALAPEHPYASWLATYADPAFAAATRQAVAIVTDAASRARPEVRARMHRAFRVSSAHELAFFDRA
ncbi:bifunctional hydroxymethylpyrimidine kinase/phosphomethylpyrimidine kinase [Agromyces silvae]|uniref:bifunctional hydroxymethylpyrimidine kinase/phosphomethylpyrimidine kinase n=1 Tax=Agromyces silvae TaxID=3388266 RepID=UPI00280B9B02|nr:bifunctional hydroxymethylpyrimidine kinase/phosphomethylpyrimidine kinase [Agromyces protaetiae]